MSKEPYLGESNLVFTDIETIPEKPFDVEEMYQEINPEMFKLKNDLDKNDNLIEYLKTKHPKTSEEKIIKVKIPELMEKHLNVLEKINKAKAGISTNPMTARILCIGFAVNNSMELSELKAKFYADGKSDKEFYDYIKEQCPPDYFYSEKPEDEKHCLERFWDVTLTRKPFRLVGFNIWSFDLWFMLFRSLKYSFPYALPFNFNTYPGKYDKNHCHDLMQVLSLYGAKNWKSLDAVIEYLGIEKKTDMDGSMIYDEFLAGNHKKIIEYSADDINKTREVFLRTEGM